MNEDNTVYDTIEVSWKEASTWEVLTVHDKTKQEAYNDAVYFGFKEPRWWQFWKPKHPVMTCWS